MRPAADPSAVVAALLMASAVALALPRRVRLPARTAPASAADAVPLAVRQRLLLSLLCGAGAAVFFGGPVGLAAGALTGLWTWRALGRAGAAAAARRQEALARELPGAVDLLVAAFRAGLSPGPALALVADAMPGPVQEELRGVSQRLDLGADPATVWRDLGGHPRLGPLGRALGRAHARGASVVPAGERLAAELRERTEAEIEARARSVSTRAAAPLGACFLPAFVLLGIVPLVAGLLDSLRLFG